MDVAPRMLVEHGRRARRVPLVTGDFYDALPFANALFDAILALFGTLAHPPDPGAHARLATEVARVLRPGGVFLAEVPSPEWLARLPDQPPSGDLGVWRVGPREALHDDRVARVSLVVVVPTRAEWLEALSPLAPTIEDAGDELYLFGRAR
jgi:SAM-dependent methyltransferase